MSKNKITYSEALTELEHILQDLENNPEVNMEQIADKVKRASLLIDVCKKQLHELDQELEKIMTELDS